GNPPWDRIKLQQVEWFAARRPEIALAQRASDRAKMIAKLKADHDPLFYDYEKADERAADTTRMARTSGHYPLLSRGDINLYSLFVERAQALVKPGGMVGLLTPSGIASDLSASAFFRSVATEGRLKALYDFENRKIFFLDVHASFKFCVLSFSPGRTFDAAHCAFYLHDAAAVRDPDRAFPITAADFAGVNPNTGTAPIFRSRRDMALTTAIYARLPVLVDRSSGEPVAAWPVRYATMFHMTNDSHLFRTRAELEGAEGAWAIGGNRFQSASGEWVPLYEGKMIQAFDHRAASVVVNAANLNRPAQPLSTTAEQHADPTWTPDPQFWVSIDRTAYPDTGWVLGFKEITAPTNVRTMIATILPAVGFGNKVPVLLPTGPSRDEWLLATNLNSSVFDFSTRQKVQGQTLNLFIVEQLPVVPPSAYDRVFGPKTARDIVREAVLELSYTAHDLAPFARDLGYVDDAGDVLPPFVWDEERRLKLRAKLDALYFILYGVFDPADPTQSRDDIRYIYSTFPIVEREEIARWGSYRSRDLALAWINALMAGQPDAEIAG
ncbi:MAG: restriction endonuclease, partial [Brevundimonas sp.]|nr:restriction endonuclease [Brevundimonas sp.]